jgi:hypothetical protein
MKQAWTNTFIGLAFAAQACASSQNSNAIVEAPETPLIAATAQPPAPQPESADMPLTVKCYTPTAQTPAKVLHDESVWIHRAKSSLGESLLISGQMDAEMGSNICYVQSTQEITRTCLTAGENIPDALRDPLDKPDPRDPHVVVATLPANTSIPVSVGGLQSQDKKMCAYSSYKQKR